MGSTSPVTRANTSSAERVILLIGIVVLLSFWTTYTVLLVTHFLAIEPPRLTEPVVGAGGLGWILIDVVGAAFLGLGIAYGLYRYYTRDKRLDPVTEAATRDMYEHPSPTDR